VRGHEQLPVAEVSAQDEHARAALPLDRLAPPRLVLEADHVEELRRGELREMRQLDGHAPEVQERLAQDPPALGERLLRERDAEVAHADAAMRHVERVRDYGDQLSDAQRDDER
jgi:hypothetical protein